MLALLARRFGDVDLADDAVQDALVAGRSRPGGPASRPTPPGWLYTVAHNRAIDRLRRAAASAPATAARRPS